MLRFLQRKAIFPALHDIIMAALSFWLSLYIRTGDELAEITPYWKEGMLLFTLIAGSVFVLMRLYKSMWRYTSLKELVDVMKAVTVAVLAFLLVLFISVRLEGMPRSSIFINWFVLVALLSGPRLLYRFIAEGSFSLEWSSVPSYQRIPVLILGMNDQTGHFLRQMEGQGAYRVVGIVEDTAQHDGRRIRGVPVFGTLAALPTILRKLQRKGNPPQKLLLAEEGLPIEIMRSVVETANHYALSVALLPRMTDFRAAQETGQLNLRPVQVEDLLGRSQKAQDKAAIRQLLAGARVLVTGAGGTIGSELVRQIAACGPAKIVLAELSEHNLYQVDMELSRHFPGVPRKAVIADVRDKARLAATFAEEKPEVVFHAAAIKHVPLAEANPAETIRTNILGTRHVADLCQEHKVEAMVLISTDKAVNPSSLMGTTKRAAEKYCQALGQMPGSSKTKFVTVRFGNVLGSSGSVIPLFEKQLKAGGPITVTHPEMTRYFMTVKEAVELVLQASALSLTMEERSMIYVLDMGEPVKIVDLATQMIRLAGLKPGEDVAISYIGLRPGEKLYEELFYQEEAPRPTNADGVMLAAPRKVTFVEVDNYLRKLEKALERGDDEAISQIIRHLVPEYS